MIALVLLLCGAFSTEVSTAMGKKAVAKRKESVYTMGFLNLFWSTIFFALSVVFGSPLVFVPESLPAFLLRLALEIVQLHVLYASVTISDRSTSVFLRLLTIPLILVVDLMLGYTISTTQIIGMSVIIGVLFWLFTQHKASTKGAFLVIFTAINAVSIISLFKYNIENFNSVAAEQLFMCAILLVYFAFVAQIVGKENPWRFLLRRFSEAQSFSYGLGIFLISNAYSFGPASVILTGERSLSLFWAILFGSKVFHEKNLATKMISLGIIIFGLYLVAR